MLSIVIKSGMMTCASDSVLLIFWGVVIFEFDHFLRYLLALISRRKEHSGVDVVSREMFHWFVIKF